MKRSLLVVACAGAAALTISPAASAQSFGLDDNPFAPISSPPGPIPGFGAENPFGIPAGPFWPPGLGPSPSLALIVPPVCLDATILMPPPVGGGPPLTQLNTPNGDYDDSLTNQTLDFGRPIRLHFSVDRVTVGLPGTAVSVQSGLNQQPGDVFRSSALFQPPIAFVGIGIRPDRRTVGRSRRTSAGYG